MPERPGVLGGTMRGELRIGANRMQRDLHGHRDGQPELRLMRDGMRERPGVLRGQMRGKLRIRRDELQRQLYGDGHG